MTSFKPTAVRFDEDAIWVDVEDGRTVGVPLAWYPRLFNATPAQRLDFMIGSRGIHWDAIDEDILVEAMFAGLGDVHRLMPAAA